ncbi:hypothetical protein FPOAC2_10454 [Fusarium poae]|uniref:hypothetical protein n=1 Tax=Fusarium poae TaxID=36050 RepID=UPI001CE95C81|nr:hypothetical protein FPOAC1_010174 [Fusarium poae]KAG8665379.1 hypothetical protein FPOAC1_010174 [Fusarium poae]
MKLVLLVIALVSLLGVADAAKAMIETTKVKPGNYTYRYYDTKGHVHPLGEFYNGCRHPDYDWVYQVCVDLKRKRARLQYADGGRRCFKQVTRSKSVECGGGARCTTNFFIDAGCNF